LIATCAGRPSFPDVETMAGQQCRAGKPTSAQMPLVIHAHVQDANDAEAAIGLSVEDEVRA
jgi:hypothetical protein